MVCPEKILPISEENSSSTSQIASAKADNNDDEYFYSEDGEVKGANKKLWNLDDFVSWCGSCEKLKGDKVKILDHIKKRLEKTDNNKLIKEDIRQKAKDLRKEFQDYMHHEVTVSCFCCYKSEEVMEIWTEPGDYRAKVAIDKNEKVIELAEIERIKVSQLRNNAEAVSKIHQCVSDSFMEFSNETIRIPKRTLESEVLAKEQDDHEELQNKRTRYVQTPPSSAEEGSPGFAEGEAKESRNRIMTSY
ncbi:9465_t:CDS:2 [Funneliformis mosseae]|uniref:9465_t:CDS:1 n=1 Tax=Funneliformis mosseae TaxID=27381 RepID=A0A9N8YSP0_FUNMO|nr:9465_t:CDS:2 [Funneliformis mosseae]